MKIYAGPNSITHFLKLDVNIRKCVDAKKRSCLEERLIYFFDENYFTSKIKLNRSVLERGLRPTPVPDGTR